jgi:DNA-binding SARP family transcriptional activator
MTHKRAADLADALDLWAGPFMDGTYEEWALGARSRLDRLYTRALCHLIMYYQLTGAVEHGITYAERLLLHEPLNEAPHRMLVSLFLAAGQPAHAAKQYDQWSEMLEREFDTAPSNEMRALLDEIIRASARLATSTAVRNASLKEIDITLSALLRARERLLPTQRDMQHASSGKRPRLRRRTAQLPTITQLELYQADGN